MPIQEAQTAPRALVEIWITRFVYYENLASYRGTNLMSELFRELCRTPGIDKTSTTSFHQERFAMIKRTTRTLEERLSMYKNDFQHE